MLDDARSIDMMLSPGLGVTMLIIQDFTPWPVPDGDERLKQFNAKLKGYAEYVASAKFQRDHPNADRTKVVISVLAVTPPSARMKAITNLNTPGSVAYEIVVRFTEGAREQAPVAKPWWKFW